MDLTLGSTLAWAWPILLAAVALPLISVINGLAGWSAAKKKATVVGVSLFLAVVYVVAARLITEVPADLSELVTRIVVVVTQAVYNFLKPQLTAIETKVGGEPEIKV